MCVCVCVWRVKTNAKDGGASFLVSSALQCLHYPMCLEYIRSHHVCGVYVDLCMRCMNITLLSYPFFIKKCNIRCVYHTSICYACIHACNTDENKKKKNIKSTDEARTRIQIKSRKNMEIYSEEKRKAQQRKNITDTKPIRWDEADPVPRERNESAMVQI